jgi:hypothetical protein
MDKKPAKVALIFITFSLFLVGSTSPIAASTVAHWKFEEGPVGSIATGSIIDSSGNNQSGTPFGGPIYLNVTNPNSNLALKFDGVNDRLVIPDNPIFRLTNQFTLEAFIRIDALTFPSGFHDIIVSRDLGVTGVDPYLLTLWSDGKLVFAVADESANYIHLRSPLPLPVGEFIHIAGTYNSGVMKLYIDGVEAASTTTSIIPAAQITNQPNTSGIGIGNTAHVGPDHPGPNHSFNGVIDEVRISNIALIPSEFLYIPPVACFGFESPMNNGPVKVRKNQGWKEMPSNAPSTLVLPLKVQVSDSGGPITDADIASPPVLQVLYDSGVIVADDVTADVLPAGVVTRGNQFIFTNDGKWGFNLGTWYYTAPGTYTISVASGDATEYVINPTCTATFVVE